MNTPELEITRQNDTVLVVFNRPNVRNALTLAMYEQLHSVCQEIIDGHLSVKSMILSGRGNKAFAAGTDINCFDQLETPDDAIAYERLMDKVMGTLEKVPVPTVAAIRGACTGGGAALAACCDFRVADDTLKFGFPIARTLGNCLSIDNLSRLVALLGMPLTRELLFTARLLNADEALNIGLVSELSDDPLVTAQALCATFHAHAPLTLAATKEGLRRLRAHSASVAGDDLIVECYTSRDFREGREAFLQKRAPQWQGC